MSFLEFGPKLPLHGFHVKPKLLTILMRPESSCQGRSLKRVSQDLRLRIAAIDFLNPAPLMWDFEHPPLDGPLATRYQIDRMLPAECANRLASGTADIGLVPIAALANHPGLRILPGCVIAAKGRVRSLLLVRRTTQRLQALRSVWRERRTGRRDKVLQINELPTNYPQRTRG